MTTESFDFEIQNSLSIRVRVTDPEGESLEKVFTLSVGNEIETLHVTSLAAMVDGFRITFSEAVDPSSLNLYDAVEILGAADLTVTGALSGLVRGSLVVDPDGCGMTFVAAGLLQADTYAVRLVSSPTAFRGVSGQTLDGNADEVAGDDYEHTVTVASAPVVSLGVASFARGPGEAVHLPADRNAGIPLELVSTGDLTTLTATLVFEPALLTVLEAAIAAELPGGSSLTLTPVSPGRMELRLDSTAPLDAGRICIGSLRAEVSRAAIYGGSGLIRFEDVQVNGGTPGAGRTSVQLAASLGETSGDGSYTAADAALAARVAMRLDSGFVAYALTDPILIADVSGNGAVSMLDAAMISAVSTAAPGPTLPVASAPRQMLLRHDGVFRATDMPDTSGLLSTTDATWVASALSAAATRARIFAELAAGWVANAAARGSDGSNGAQLTPGTATAGDGPLFAEVGMNE